MLHGAFLNCLNCGHFLPHTLTAYTYTHKMVSSTFKICRGEQPKSGLKLGACCEK